MGLDVDKNTRSEIAYLAARHYFQDSQEGMPLGMLRMVDAKSAVFPDAQALNGVVLTQQGRFNDALAPLITAQQVGRTQDRGSRFDNVLTLNLARSYFAAGNYLRAIEHYAKVERESDFWPQAHFERAWAHFRQGDVKGTVAVLMSHESPFFEDWYFPEADLLRTYSLFMMCKFPDAGTEISKFEQRYTPVKEQLKSGVAALTEQQAWEEAVAYLNGETHQYPAALLRKFASDERFLAAVASTQKAEDELKRLKNVANNPFAAVAMQRLDARKGQLIAEEGARVKAHLGAARDELMDMLSNVQITKLDIMNYETALLEKAANTGKLDYGDRIGQLRRLRKKKGVQVWPFQGEYWGMRSGIIKSTPVQIVPRECRLGNNLAENQPWGIYIHIPWCRRRCPYCAFYVEVDRGPDWTRFIDAVHEDWKKQKPFFSGQPSTVFLGGGTPTRCPPKYLRPLLEPFASSTTEISMECNPEDITPERLHDWRNIGIHRLSMECKP